jgi:hypothetical protein
MVPGDKESLDMNSPCRHRSTTLVNQRKAKKAVAFETTTKLYRTIHVSDYTADELNASWYNASDYAKIRSNVQSVLSKMDLRVEKSFERQFNSHSNRKYAALMRGLESLTASGAISKKLRRQEAIGGVLREQRRQLEEHGQLVDGLGLANVYSEYTRISMRLARELGHADEQDVIRWHRKPALTSGPLSTFPPLKPFSYDFIDEDRQRENDRRMCKHILLALSKVLEQ